MPHFFFRHSKTLQSHITFSMCLRIDRSERSNFTGLTLSRFEEGNKKMINERITINQSTQGLKGVRGSGATHIGSRPNSTPATYGSVETTVKFINNLGFDIQMVDRHGFRRTLKHTHPLPENRQHRGSITPDMGHEYRKVYMEVTYNYLGNGTGPKFDQGYKEFISNIELSFTRNMPEYHILKESLAQQVVAYRPYGNATSDVVYSVTVLYYLGIDDLTSVGFNAYWAEADVVLSKEEFLEDVPAHPYYCRREANDPDHFPEHLMANDFKDGFYLKIVVVDNTRHRTNRYFKFLGTVKEVETIADSTKRDGVYITEAVPISAVKSNRVMYTQYMSFEDADKILGLFKSKEEADSFGDAKHKEQLIAAQINRETAQINKELKTIAIDIAKTTHEREEEHARMKYEREMEMLKERQDLEKSVIQSKAASEKIKADIDLVRINHEKDKMRSEHEVSQTKHQLDIWKNAVDVFKYAATLIVTTMTTVLTVQKLLLKKE